MAIKSKSRHDLTLRSIKREIAAGRDVAYWLDKAYTHLDNGLLTEDDIAEVEALAQAYYDALDAEDKANAEEITQQGGFHGKHYIRASRWLYRDVRRTRTFS